MLLYSVEGSIKMDLLKTPTAGMFLISKFLLVTFKPLVSKFCIVFHRRAEHIDVFVCKNKLVPTYTTTS